MRIISVILPLLMCASALAGKTIVVAADGTGDVRTVQDAIAAAPAGAAERTIIHIKAGTYLGPIIVPKEKARLTFEGEGTDQTILSWDHNVFDPAPPGTGQFDPGVHIHADDFQARDLTIQNTSGDHGQALALRVDSDRNVFRRCRIIGWQDTLMINNGRDYFDNCTIAGRVDFIYGSATAWFEGCEIHSRNGGHVTAASTPADHPFGFVFHRCRLTGDSIAFDPASTNPATTQQARVTPVADLGRPWRPFASVTYLNCEMGQHINPAGWNNWRKTSNEKTARYAEYHSTGPGGDASHRVPWSHQLTDAQAQAITLQNVLSGSDGWDPRAAMTATPR